MLRRRPPVGSPVTSNFSGAWNGADLGVELLNTVLYSVAGKEAVGQLGWDDKSKAVDTT